MLQGGQKRWMSTVDSWSDSSDIVQVTNTEGAAYPEGPSSSWVGIRPGNLIAYGGAVYFITNDGGDWLRGQKGHVANPTVLSQCFPNLPYPPVDALVAGLHTTGTQITSCLSVHPNGTAVAVPNDAVYWVHANKVRHVISQAVQDSWFLGPDLVTITAAERNRYAVGGGPIGFRPGRLISNSSDGAIYFVTNEGDFGKATKRHVGNGTTLNCLFPGEPIIGVTAYEANNNPTVTPALVVSGC